MFKKLELKELSLSFGGIGVTLEKKGNELKHEILREMFVIRHTLSDFYYRYEAINDKMSYEEPDEETRSETIANLMFEKVFETYLDLSKFFLGSKYFVLLTKQERQRTLSVFDNITSVKVSMEENEDFYLDAYEQVELMEDLNVLFHKIDKEIEAIIETIDQN
ncbi:hypothetical protein [Paenibacillus tundrae]